jgi:hypothetical protein
MTKLVNRAKMTTATTGTGTLTLGSAVDGYQTFADAGVADADVVRYVIEDGDAWEIGLGTYSSSGGTLTRTAIESSNSDSALNLSGNAVVFVTAAGADIQQPPAEGAFVDGDKTKLDGIEANADVTDTANVTAAGALMDSELTDIAAVKALDQGVATTDSPSFAGLTATTADINGGTIDGAVIGGTTPAAISGTTGTLSGNLTVDTNTLFVDAASNNVGIGTSSPIEKLDVNGTVKATGINLGGTAVTATAAEINVLDGVTLTTSQLNAANSNGLFATYGGTANAITLTTGAALQSIPDGFRVRFRATAANTGAATANIDGLGAKDIVTVTGVALPADYIRLGNTSAAIETVMTWSATEDAWIADRAPELGSNANGVFERFADGTMICRRDVIKDNGSTNAQTFSWPATFATTDDLGLSIHNKGGSFGSLLHFESVGVSSFQVRVVSVADAGASSATRSGPATAIGLWY